MNRAKKLSLILMALVLVVSVWGCASSKGPQTTLPHDTSAQPLDTTVPEVTVEYQEVTDPEFNMTINAEPFNPKPGISAGTDAETSQLRVSAQSDAWQEAFRQNTGCYAVVSSLQELNDLAEIKLAGHDMDLSAYDDAFFAANRLVLIPRSSNTGSVTYQAKLNVDGESVHIELDARMSGIGTADMAQWLVLVTLPNAEYGAMDITVPEAGGTGAAATK